MAIGIVILLLLAVIFLWRIAFGPRFLPAAYNEWLVLEWHAVLHGGDAAKRIWDTNAPIEIQFVPIIGWKYDHYGYKYGKPAPITPPAYHVQKRLDADQKYETLSYWLRDDVVFDISDEWRHAGDLWEHLSDYAIGGAKIAIHGNVPSCCQRRLSEILALADAKDNKKGT